MPPGRFLGEVFWACPTRWRPQGRANPGHTGEMISPRTSWRRSRLLCLGCCPRDPAPDEYKKTDGRMDGWMEEKMQCSIRWASFCLCFSGGSSEVIRGLASGTAHTGLCPVNTKKTPSDYDILLPQPALEDTSNSRPPFQPPPPPPARHSFIDMSSSSSSSSCNSSTSSTSVITRPHRPSSGHEHFLITTDSVFGMLNSSAPLPAAKRHTDNVKSSRGGLEYDHLPHSQVSVDCLQAPARPPKPYPRKIPPEIQPEKPHSLESESEDAKIAKLMGEGYTFDDVKRALMIAQYKVDVARNILQEFALVTPRLNL